MHAKPCITVHGSFTPMPNAVADLAGVIYATIEIFSPYACEFYVETSSAIPIRLFRKAINAFSSVSA